MSSLLESLANRVLNGGWSPEQIRQNKRRQKHSAELQRVLSSRPDPLPSNLPSVSTASLESSISLQKTSLLFTLPPEIRQRIYIDLLGNHLIHLIHIHKAIACLTKPIPLNLFAALTSPCQHRTSPTSPTRPDSIDARTLTLPPSIETWTDELALIPAPNQLPGPGALPLLQSCRAIYTEAHPLLYTHNIFVLSSPLPLLYLHTLTLPHSHFQLIRHLRLHWRYFSDPESMAGVVHAPYDFGTWKSFWEIVGEMEGLDGRGSLGVWVEYWGGEERVSGLVGCIIEAGKRRGKPIQRVDMGVEWRIGPWRSERRRELEEVIREAWMGREEGRESSVEEEEEG